MNWMKTYERIFALRYSRITSASTRCKNVSESGELTAASALLFTDVLTQCCTYAASFFSLHVFGEIRLKIKKNEDKIVSCPCTSNFLSIGTTSGTFWKISKKSESSTNRKEITRWINFLIFIFWFQDVFLQENVERRMTPHKRNVNMGPSTILARCLI